MAKKSSSYMGAGMLLILYLVLMPMLSIAVMTGAFQGLTFKIYFSHLEWKTMIWYGAMALTALLCFGKALVDELIPDIALVGLFGLIALVEILGLFGGELSSMYGVSKFRILLSNLLSIGVFGSMAGLIFLKDAFGEFYFAPAALKVVHIIVNALLYMFSHVGFMMVLMLLIGEILLAWGLLLLGKAVTNN